MQELESAIAKFRGEVHSLQTEKASLLDERSDLRKSLVTFEQAFLMNEQYDMTRTGESMKLVDRMSRFVQNLRQKYERELYLKERELNDRINHLQRQNLQSNVILDNFKSRLGEEINRISECRSNIVCVISKEMRADFEELWLQNSSLRTEVRSLQSCRDETKSLVVGLHDLVRESSYCTEIFMETLSDMQYSFDNAKEIFQKFRKFEKECQNLKKENTSQQEYVNQLKILIEIHKDESQQQKTELDNLFSMYADVLQRNQTLEQEHRGLQTDWNIVHEKVSQILSDLLQMTSILDDLFKLHSNADETMQRLADQSMKYYFYVKDTNENVYSINVMIQALENIVFTIEEKVTSSLELTGQLQSAVHLENEARELRRLEDTVKVKKLQELSSEVSYLHQCLEEKQCTLELVNNENEKLKSVREKLENEISELKSENRNVLQENQVMASTVSSLKLTIDDFKLQSSMYERNIDHLCKLTLSLETQTDLFESNFVSLWKSRCENEDRMRSLESELDTSMMKRHATEDQQRRAELIIEHQSEMIRSLQNKNEELQDQCEQTLKQLASERNKSDLILEQLNASQELIAKDAKEISSLRAIEAVLNDRVRMLESSASELKRTRKEIRSSHIKLGAYQETISISQDELNYLRSCNQSLSEDLQQISRENQDLKSQNFELQKQFKELFTAADELQSSIQIIDQKYSSITQSKFALEKSILEKDLMRMTLELRDLTISDLKQADLHPRKDAIYMSYYESNVSAIEWIREATHRIKNYDHRQHEDSEQIMMLEAKSSQKNMELQIVLKEVQNQRLMYESIIDEIQNSLDQLRFVHAKEQFKHEQTTSIILDLSSQLCTIPEQLQDLHEALKDLFEASQSANQEVKFILREYLIERSEAQRLRLQVQTLEDMLSQTAEHHTKAVSALENTI
eukprot:763565-Hanusia_phi.AAC.2